MTFYDNLIKIRSLITPGCVCTT